LNRVPAFVEIETIEAHCFEFFLKVTLAGQEQRSVGNEKRGDDLGRLRVLLSYSQLGIQTSLAPAAMIVARLAFAATMIVAAFVMPAVIISSLAFAASQ
jgi:hypothetical protein